jgi:hypothetical protein
MWNSYRRKRIDLFSGIRLLAILALVFLFSSCGEYVSEKDPLLTDTPGPETGYGTDREGEDLPDTDEKPKLVLTEGVVDSKERIVLVNVSIENNPGISALQFHVHYGEELVLQSIQFDPRFDPYVTAPTPYKNPQMITFLSPLGEVSEDGLFAVMTFRITDHAEQKTSAHIRASIVSENTLTENLEEIEFEVVNCAVTIE